MSWPTIDGLLDGKSAIEPLKDEIQTRAKTLRFLLFSIVSRPIYKVGLCCSFPVYAILWAVDVWCHELGLLFSGYGSDLYLPAGSQGWGMPVGGLQAFLGRWLRFCAVLPLWARVVFFFFL